MRAADRVVLGNGGLPTGDPEPNAAFKAWCEFSQKTPTFDTSKIIQGGCASKPLAPEVLAAYDAPYPDESYKAGARIFPTLVPASLDYPSSKENLAAWEELKKWTKPFHCAFSDGDPVTRKVFLDGNGQPLQIQRADNAVILKWQKYPEKFWVVAPILSDIFVPG